MRLPSRLLTTTRLTIPSLFTAIKPHLPFSIPTLLRLSPAKRFQTSLFHPPQSDSELPDPSLQPSPSSIPQLTDTQSHLQTSPPQTPSSLFPSTTDTLPLDLTKFLPRHKPPLHPFRKINFNPWDGPPQIHEILLRTPSHPSRKWLRSPLETGGGIERIYRFRNFFLTMRFLKAILHSTHNLRNYPHWSSHHTTIFIRFHTPDIPCGISTLDCNCARICDNIERTITGSKIPLIEVGEEEEGEWREWGRGFGEGFEGLEGEEEPDWEWVDGRGRRWRDGGGEW